MQKKLLKDAIFLLSRLDIIPRIQNLTIGVAWSQRHLEWAGIDIGTPEYTSFLRPVWAGFGEVLPRAVNVSNLYCMSVQLTQSLLTTMVGLPMLHTLKLHTCTVAIDQSLDNFPYLPQVVNVILAQTHDISDHSSLRCLRLFPNLRMLAVTGFTRQELGLLDEAFRERCNPFRTLERVIVTHLNHEEVPLLSAWIRAAKRSGESLRLTHFKLMTEVGLKRDVLMDLISSLEGAALHTLSLDGLSYVGADLFEAIARLFPDLHTLTLVHRQNLLQRECKPSVWPGPSWENAQHLAAFRSLKMFSWNFAISLIDGSAFDLPCLEEGYPDELPWWERADDFYIYDWESYGRLFAAYCPSLEVLLFLERNFVSLECTMARSQTDGKVKVQASPMPITRTMTHLMEQINPDISFGFENPWVIGINSKIQEGPSPQLP